MWMHNLNPTLVKIGFLEIRYYGLVYVLGFFLAVLWMMHLSKKGKLNLNQNEIWDFTFYAMLGVLIGSRLFELFWEPGYYLSNPLNLLKFWQGGMSFHGGLVGVTIAGWLYCRKKRILFWRMADILSTPAMLALALGRIANFINGELVGRVWNGKWCVVFPDYDGACRHPSMIYAAFQRFAVFGGLLFLTLRDIKDHFKPGFIFWNFVFWEGAGRIIVDFFREDKLFYGLSLGQWFSVVMVLLAGFIFLKYYKEDWRKIFKR